MHLDGFSPIYAEVLKIEKNPIFSQIFMSVAKMFEMHIDERYDAKCPLSVMWATYTMFCWSEKIIELGHQNSQNVRFLCKTQKKFKIFYMLESTVQYVF